MCPCGHIAGVYLRKGRKNELFCDTVIQSTIHNDRLQKIQTGTKGAE